MKNLLSENMLRFGTKNLSESQKKQLTLKSIMKTIEENGLTESVKSLLMEGTRQLKFERGGALSGGDHVSKKVIDAMVVWGIQKVSPKSGKMNVRVEYKFEPTTKGAQAFKFVGMKYINNVIQNGGTITGIPYRPHDREFNLYPQFEIVNRTTAESFEGGNPYTPSEDSIIGQLTMRLTAPDGNVTKTIPIHLPETNKPTFVPLGGGGDF